MVSLEFLNYCEKDTHHIDIKVVKDTTNSTAIGVGLLVCIVK